MGTATPFRARFGLDNQSNVLRGIGNESSISAASAGADALRISGGVLQISNGTIWEDVGSGSGSANVWRQFTQNVATNPQTSGSFTVTTTGLTTSSPVVVMQATGTGGNADDIEWDGIVANGIATSSTQFTCYWSAPHPVSGSKNFNYLQV